jgi:hypothetical protein
MNISAAHRCSCTSGAITQRTINDPSIHRQQKASQFIPSEQSSWHSCRADSNSHQAGTGLWNFTFDYAKGSWF